MIYLKSVLVGMAAAMAASVIYICTVLVLPLFLPFLLSRIAGDDGAVGMGFMVSSGPVTVIALVAFVAGFYWEFRRVSVKR